MTRARMKERGALSCNPPVWVLPYKERGKQQKPQ
jgi:hypothetical protein